MSFDKIMKLGLNDLENNYRASSSNVPVNVTFCSMLLVATIRASKGWELKTLKLGVNDLENNYRASSSNVLVNVRFRSMATIRASKGLGIKNAETR